MCSVLINSQGQSMSGAIPCWTCQLHYYIDGAAYQGSWQVQQEMAPLMLCPYFRDTADFTHLNTVGGSKIADFETAPQQKVLTHFVYPIQPLCSGRWRNGGVSGGGNFLDIATKRDEEYDGPIPRHTPQENRFGSTLMAEKIFTSSIIQKNQLI